MTVPEIKTQIAAFREQGLSVVASSSFQTHSIPMLHILSEITPAVPVLMLNTGYHFPETIAFKNEIGERLGLEVIDLRSATPKSQQKDSAGNLLFVSDTDRCCYLNKVRPMEVAMKSYDVWISGIRADQNANRASMKAVMNGPDGSVRFHPMLDWSSKMIYDYRVANELPEHPLEERGIFNVGCEPCTAPSVADLGRTGRWFGQHKTECGLHTELVKAD